MSMPIEYGVYRSLGDAFQFSEQWSQMSITI